MDKDETDAVKPDRAGLNRCIAAIAADGDKEAFAALFSHFAPRVKTYLLRLGAGPAVADDLAQETLLTVWRKAGSFDPAKASASTWIFTIARNLRIDVIRRERHPEVDADEALETPDNSPLPDENLAHVQREEHIRAALAVLPAEQAEVIRLSFFEDKPHSEIERTLGIPLGTVKSRLRLAMTRLRAALGEDL